MLMNRAKPGRIFPALILPAILAIPFLAPWSARAQAPQGYIAYIFPAGGQQGQTLQVTVSGTDLDDAKGVRIAGGGVAGEVVKIDQGKTATVSLTITPDAQPGQRDFRLLTPGGVTNRFRFIVGQVPEIVEQEPNSEIGEAQTLPPLPVVVNGQIVAPDKDTFRFSAKAGETIVCRVQAQELLPFIADAVPGWFNAVLTLYDAAGHHLAYVDDFRFHPDPVLIYQVERDGDYLVEIKDSVYRGREDFVYRLSIGRLPFVTHVYPLGGKRQTTAKIDLFGVNLSQSQMELELSADEPPLRRVQCNGNGILSNWRPFAVGENAETQETEPNNTTGQANPVEPPITINGRIDQPGDVDYFTFTAQEKQALVMEVQARRLDSPLDSMVTLFDSNGKSLAENDDAEDECSPYITHHADSRLLYTFKAAGKHVLRIADVQGKGGPEYAYRLTIAPPRPDFQLRVTPDNPRVGQGATTVLTVNALRRDGFNGQIDLKLTNLPPGFTASGDVVPEGLNDAIVSLTSLADAALDRYTPTIVGSAVIDGQAITRPVLPVEDVMQAFYYHHLLPTEEFLLTVVEPGPFSLIPLVPPEGYIRFESGRTAFVDIKAVRTQQAKGIIRLSLYNPPKGVRMTNVSIAADQNEAKCEIRYPNQLPANVRFNLVVSGSMKIGPKTLTSITPVIVALGPQAKAPQVTKPAATKP